MRDQLETQNLYDVLGLSREATAEQVRNAFRVRSHMFHPDKYETYPEPLRGQLKTEAAKEFKRLTAAYDVLRDPARRAAHDRQLEAGWTTAPSVRRRPSGTRRNVAPSPRSQPAPERPDDASEDAAGETQQTAGATARGARRRRATTAANQAPPPPRERDPLLVVRPDGLDFGAIAPGASKQLPLRISNAGGRTLFGEITSNRSWLSVNRRSFISSSALVFVAVDARGLRAGESYAGSLAVSTLNGGDQIVPVAVRVTGRPEPVLAGAPPLLDFGVAQAGTNKARTIRLSNAGTGTLIGSVAVRGSWLAVTETNFRGNALSFEVIASTAGLPPGEHEGEVLLFTNGGQATIHASVDVAAPAGSASIVQRAAAGEDDTTAGRADREDRAPEAREAPESGVMSGSSRESVASGKPQPGGKDAQRALVGRITSIEPQTVWERDFLRRIVQLVRAGEDLAPGELAKIYELEARARGGSSADEGRERR